MKLRLDLHTHPFEATDFAPLTIRLVEQMVTIAKSRGLNGFAVTEHHNKSYGYRVKEIVERYLDEKMIIIPGQEIDIIGLGQQIVELYLPGERVFRFLAHPGQPGGSMIIRDGVKGIELDNGLHGWKIPRRRVRQIAQSHDLLLLTNSDAHDLKDIGSLYNELSWEELYAKTIPLPIQDR